jgi:hypothetical protein
MFPTGSLTFAPFFCWMVHFYPYEANVAKASSTEDDAAGNDNVDHDMMPGMKIP